MLKEGFGGDWLSSRALMRKLGLDRKVWQKKRKKILRKQEWEPEPEEIHTQWLWFFLLCFQTTLLRVRNWIEDLQRLLEVLYICWKQWEKLLKKIKELITCSKGLFEVRHLNFVMVEWSSTITRSSPSRTPIFIQ